MASDEEECRCDETDLRFCEHDIEKAKQKARQEVIDEIISKVAKLHKNRRMTRKERYLRTGLQSQFCKGEDKGFLKVEELLNRLKKGSGGGGKKQGRRKE